MNIVIYSLRNIYICYSDNHTFILGKLVKTENKIFKTVIHALLKINTEMLECGSFFCKVKVIY